MSKVPEQSIRRKLRGPTYIFFAAFFVGTLSVLLGVNVASGTALYYVIRGAALIAAISGFYIAKVAAQN